VRGSAGGGAARAAAALAFGALAWGAPPRAPEPDACAVPRRLAGGGLARVVCAGDAGRPLEGAERLLFGAGLDPNRASPRALGALPGIGPVRAAAIVREARARAFCRPEDLARVPGIGPRRLARLADWIEIEPGACSP